MIEAWMNREMVDGRLPPDAVDFRTLTYDPDYGHYCGPEGEPFTGVCFTRWGNGALESVAGFVGGMAEGVSVAWRHSGTIELYREMRQDVVDGVEVLWDEDGHVRSSSHFVRGRLQPTVPDVTVHNA